MCDSAPEGVSLAHVAVVFDNLEMGRYNTFGLACRSVGIAVRDYNHLVSSADHIELAQEPPEVRSDVTGFAVCRHDDRQLDSRCRNLVSPGDDQALRQLVEEPDTHARTS